MEPQELGPYLLLRKLSENVLCETYRAGLRSGQEVERVVLLFSFKTDPDSAIWIAETANAGRRAFAGVDSPFLSPATDSGEVDGTAFLTYDYIPGRSLKALLERLRAQESAAPLEHALLITDRIAQGLLAAWEHESRALHGFVVPHLVMLSNEGDVRLLGMEVASRLRKLLTDSQVKHEMGRYLAEEVVPEGQPSTTDDVFSLGVILYELTTGEALPPMPEGGFDSLIAQATIADGSPLPDPIADLLRSSLAPSPNRRDLKGWQAQLSEFLVSGQYDVNAFNLALFLHGLFPDDLEADDAGDGGVPAEARVPEQEIAEIVEEIAPRLEGAVAAPEDGMPALYEEPETLLDEDHEQSSSRNRTLGIAAGIAAVVLAGLGIYSLMGGSSDATPESENISVDLVPVTASNEDRSAETASALSVERQQRPRNPPWSSLQFLLRRRSTSVCRNSCASSPRTWRAR